MIFCSCRKNSKDKKYFDLGLRKNNEIYGNLGFMLYLLYKSFLLSSINS